MNIPKVSIIVPTKNNKRTIKKCIQSLLDQTYPNIEIIMIDNFSDDGTDQIAIDLGINVISFGPERNLQRPKGAEVATGDWLVFIDSDMYFSPWIIEDCMNQVQKDPMIKAFFLPEISVGKNFWTKCKTLERAFYIYYKPLNMVRAIERTVYDQSGGWDKELISGEDIDLHEKIQNLGVKIGRSSEFIEHDEGEIKLISYLKKKFYYGTHHKKYIQHSAGRKSKGKLARKLFFMRSCFYTNPKKAFRHPILYIGMFFLLGMTLSAYLLGMMFNKKSS